LVKRRRDLADALGEWLRPDSAADLDALARIGGTQLKQGAAMISQPLLCHSAPMLFDDRRTEVERVWQSCVTGDEIHAIRCTFESDVSHVRERPDLLDRRQKMRSHEMKEGNTYRDVDGQSGRHGGHRSAPQNSGGHSERECERRVTNRRYITRIENQRGETAGVDCIDGTGPPCQHPTHQPRGQHARSADHGEFRQ